MLSQNWPRPYFQTTEQSPHLFYAVLGNIEFSEEVQGFADGLPKNLACGLMPVSSFREGAIWEQLLSSDPELARRAENTEKAVIVEGSVAYQNDLDYLRSTVDFLSYLTDIGGEIVYDPYTLLWLGSEQWNERHADGQLFNPFDHVRILTTPEENGCQWFHSRGMRKFGRPDLSVHSVPEAKADSVKIMLDRFITFLALGGVTEEGREVVLEGLEAGYRPGPVAGDSDDPDFNNWHVEIRRP